MDEIDDMSDGSGDMSVGEEEPLAEETLTEFRAGLMHQRSNQLQADPRRGLVRLRRMPDGLVRFQWLERVDAAPLAAPPEPEINFILFPGEATLSKLARPNARLFKLTFAEDASRNLFFWAQEPDAAGDDGTVAAVNAAANAGPPVDEGGDDASSGDGEEDDPAAALAASLGGGVPRPIAAADLAAALRNIGLPPPPGAPSVPAAAGSGGVDASALAAALAAAASQGGATGGSGATGGGGDAGAARSLARAAPGPSLGAVLRPAALLPLLQDGTALQHLAEHLPESQRTQETLLALASSSQLRHQLDTFSAALTSGQLDLTHFGLRARGFGVADFLQAIQDSVDDEAKAQGGGGNGGGASGAGRGEGGEGGADGGDAGAAAKLADADKAPPSQ